MSALISLLKSPRFMPLFAAQALGAFVDNIFKNAMTILILFKLTQEHGNLLGTVAAGLFMLPFVLFSGTAGLLADKHDNAMLVRRIKVAEILLVLAGAASLVLGNIPLMMAVLFGLGIQSTFFGPIKYGILPELVEDKSLPAANGLVEAGTFLSILAGTVLGGVLILADGGPWLISGLGLAAAVCGLVAAYRLPSVPGAAPDLQLGWNFLSRTAALVRTAKQDQAVWRCILGISWFWTIGAVFLAQFPAFTKEVLAADNSVVTLLMVVFSIGVGVGSLVGAKLLRDRVSAVPVPLAGIGISLSTLAMLSVDPVGIASGSLRDIPAYLADPSSWIVLIALFGAAVCGGIFSLPLYTLLQKSTVSGIRSRMIAANNVVNAITSVVAIGMVAAALALGADSVAVLTGLAVLNLAVSAYISLLLPNELFAAGLRTALRLFYRIEVRGLEHYEKVGPRAVICPTHQSFLDAVALGAFLPSETTYAMSTTVSKIWWMRPIVWAIRTFKLANLALVEPTSPMATKTLIREVQANRKIVIFPEGRITVTGGLMKVYPGPAVIADKTGAEILPVRLEGFNRTPFGKMAGKIRVRFFPKLVMTFMPPVKLQTREDMKGRARRDALSLALYDIMTGMIVQTSDTETTILQAVSRARDTHGGKHVVIEDMQGTRLTYDRLLAGSFVLGRHLRNDVVEDEIVGVMLPNAGGAVVSFLALHTIGKIPAMVNFGTGAEKVLPALRGAGVRTVITSRLFLANATKAVRELAAEMETEIRFIYADDIKARISQTDKIRGLIAARNPDRHAVHVSPNSPAVVLFTSGSEGAPKGVVLSHRNLLFNCAQVAARVDFTAKGDQVFNALPLFHSFGLTGGTLLPIVHGVPVFLYPTPLHFAAIPEVVYNIQPTILFGTDTFLRNYLKKATSGYDFRSLRYIFAGAERLKEETRTMFAEKAQRIVFEGYGATETGPVLAVNTPMHNRFGTVGRLLDGIAYRLVSVPGIEQGGRLFVKGPNVMLGYLKADKPGVIQAPEDGWYDTGDIVTVSDERYITIKGRAKRISKISGEMIPLDEAETYAAQLWPTEAHAVVALPCPRKGERLVLVTTKVGAEVRDLMVHAKSKGAVEIMVPRTIIHIDRIPVLATGKTDYPAVEKYVIAQEAAAVLETVD